MNDKKRNLTLNLPPANCGVDTKNCAGLQTPDILRIFSGGNMLTPTSNAFIEKKLKTESYDRSFEAGNEYHLDSNPTDGTRNDFSKSNNTSMNSTNDGSSNNDTTYPYSSAPLPLVDLIMTVESEEMNTVSSIDSSPRLSPIDMNSQEEAKLELKRKRNREAASRCRKRKLENISKLEDAVKRLKEENDDLSQMLCKLKEEYSSLQQKFYKHRQSGCILTGPM